MFRRCDIKCFVFLFNCRKSWQFCVNDNYARAQECWILFSKKSLHTWFSQDPREENKFLPQFHQFNSLKRQAISKWAMWITPNDRYRCINVHIKRNKERNIRKKIVWFEAKQKFPEKKELKFCCSGGSNKFTMCDVELNIIENVQINYLWCVALDYTSHIIHWLSSRNLGPLFLMFQLVWHIFFFNVISFLFHSRPFCF